MDLIGVINRHGDIYLEIQNADIETTAKVR